MKLRRQILSLSLLLSGFVTSAVAATETYVIDPVHSSIGFSIRHFVSKVPGSFTRVTGSIVFDRDNPEKSAVDATVDIDSINTANEKRDGHLKAPDFFDATKFGTATFKSKAWKKTGESTFDVTGDLTIKGVTKEVVLKTTLLGLGAGMKGAPLSGWEATTTIDKTAFGVSGPAMLGKALGDEVVITINIEAGAKG